MNQATKEWTEKFEAFSLIYFVGFSIMVGVLESIIFGHTETYWPAFTLWVLSFVIIITKSILLIFAGAE